MYRYTTSEYGGGLDPEEIHTPTQEYKYQPASSELRKIQSTIDNDGHDRLWATSRGRDYPQSRTVHNSQLRPQVERFLFNYLSKTSRVQVPKVATARLGSL